MGDQIPTTSSHQKPLPSIEEFRDQTNIVERVTDIRYFSFNVRYQKSGILGQRSATDALRTDGYSVLNDLLETSGIHYLHVLEAKPAADQSGDKQGSSGDPLLEFSFNHDTLHCRFQFYPDRFEIYRQSSSFVDFYEWYSAIMPEAARIEMTLRQVVHHATQHSLRPVQTDYRFSILFSNFRRPEGVRPDRNAPNRDLRNMDVLDGIISQLPTSRRIAESTDEQFYRVDLTLSKRELFHDVARNTWYIVEAPFNKKGRFIEFRPELRNASAEILKDGEVVGMQPFDNDFSEDYRIAILDFLRDRALEDFAWQLLKGWDFDTERQL